MKIAEIKNYAWNKFLQDDDSIGFEFKGKRISYPWLDFKTGSYELTTMQAIIEYGHENIKRFCSDVAPLCTGQIPTMVEWADEISESTPWAYDRWIEDEVTFADGRILGLSM